MGLSFGLFAGEITYNFTGGYDNSDGPCMFYGSINIPAGTYTVTINSYNGNTSGFIASRAWLTSLSVPPGWFTQSNGSNVPWSHNSTVAAGQVFTINVPYTLHTFVFSDDTCSFNSSSVINVTFSGDGIGVDAPVITSTHYPDLIYKNSGDSFSYTITATGSPTISYGVAFPNLPSFLTFDGVDTISGTIPSDYASNFSFGVTASNDYGSDSETVDVMVTYTSNEPPVITSAVTVDATAGQAFSYTTTATGSPTITYGSSGLPVYLIGTGSSISGTIPASLTDVSFSFTVTATNDYGLDSKLVTVNAVAGSGDGRFDSDDDVPAINAMNTSVTNAVNSVKASIDSFALDFDEYRAVAELRHQQFMNWLTNFGTFFDAFGAYLDVIAVNSNQLVIDTSDIKSYLQNMDTNLSDINANINTNFSNIESLLTSMNSSVSSLGSDISSIKTTLEQSLTVQESILDILENDTSSVEMPVMPSDEDIGAMPVISYSLDIDSDHEALEREVQSYTKEFPQIENALRQRTGTLDLKLIIPFSKISSSMDDYEVNFCQGTLGDLVAAVRMIIASVLYYFTLKLWFGSIKRIAD